MKKILFLLFVFISVISYAQLDREHWFAPMFDGQSNGEDEQFLHLSSNETTPFNVKVYSNNILVAQKTISKGNPGVIIISRNPNLNEINRDQIITGDYSDLHFIINKGLYVKADKPCFANLRFGVTNHTEIITSKGTAGIGTKFYTVVAPSSQVNSTNTNLGFAASFMATENNTSVTVNNFKKPLIFNAYGAATGFTFKLNKGQSYIIDGRTSDTNSTDGFIGAEVNADKPISMSNGNFNGQYATTNTSSGSDILMDQSVPVDKLGAEFVIVKGFGVIGNNMEGAIIVATEPNTAIYLNDSTTPAKTLVNPGDYYKVTETSYVNRGNSHYNLHIITDKNVYVYQLLAGVAAGSAPFATGGMNYIPPLNCYLPKKIDEISYINYLSDVPHKPAFSTKLNIITEKGGLVKVNGVIPNPSFGPYEISNISTSQKWVSYSVPNVTGNITVESSKAVTAGIASGNAAFGYGGYFAGFSSIPLILKTDGDCLPGVTLEVTEGFESYQWLENVNGTYVPAPGVNTLFQYSPTQAGIYAVKVKQGSCAEIQTKDYKFFNCTTYTNYNYTTCTTQVVPAAFALSSQTVNIPTITIDTPPTKGSVVKNSDGTITYTANPNATGSDTFKFSFFGIGSIPDFETVQATVNLNQIEKYDVILTECSATGTAAYNLTLAAITPDATVTKKYFTDPVYTNQIPVGQLTNYNSAPGFVYVQISNTFGCNETAKIELKIKIPPAVNPALYTTTHCDEEMDGIIDGNYKVDLSTITPAIVQNPTNFTVKYYADQAKAIAGLPADVLTGNFTFTANTSVWIRVDSPDTCAPVIKEVFLKIGAKAPLISLVISKDVCDLQENNTEPVDLANYIPLFSSSTGTSATYFNNLVDAQNNTPTIPASQIITGNKTFYYRLNAPGFCNEIGTLNIVLSKGTPTALLNAYPVCAGSSIKLTAEDSPVYTTWSWKKGGIEISSTKEATLTAGIYTVAFTDSSGCIFTKTITVTDSPKPVINTSAFTTTFCDGNFDGVSDPVNFNTITPIIITNFVANPGVFTVKYYLSEGDRDLGNGNTIPNLTNFTFTSNTTIYFTVESPVCPLDKGQFDLKFTTSLILTSAVVPITICDNDLNGTEMISLTNYLNLFTTETGVSVQYFATLADAQNNSPTANLSQPITGNSTFYYRFTKANLCDVIGTLNIIFKASTPTALLNSYTVCTGDSKQLIAEDSPIYTAWSWIKGGIEVSNTKEATLTAGIYDIAFTNDSGCIFTKTITVTDSPKPIIDTAAFTTTFCDSNFDGISDPVNFNTITPIIITNFVANPGVFTVKYYLSEGDRDLGNGNTIPNLTNFTFTSNTIIYFTVESIVCPSDKGQFDLKFNNSLILTSAVVPITICDDDFDGIKLVNLANYISKFTADAGVTATYYNSLAEAQNSSNPILTSTVIVNNSATFYLRFQKNNFCEMIGKLDLTIQKAVKSKILIDKNICPDATTNLDAGPGFDGYSWSTGETTQKINVPVGDYYVDLLTNNCTYRQNVSVKAVSLPTITSVEIKGSTVTVNVTGGSPPYQYAIDGNNYQTSNVFTNVRGGDHTIYVISADNCDPVTTEINVIELFNAITPNADGINDFLNYSALLKKDEPFLQIYDRYGKIVFKGDKNNRFFWDGKAFGKAVITGSYWYIMKWKEPGFSTLTEYSGWVLVKNRE